MGVMDKFLLEMISVEGVALVLSSIAIIVSFGQFISERNRNRREATIHAFDDLEELVFSHRYYEPLVIKLEGKYILNVNSDGFEESWSRATLALSRIEHFSVGVNAKIYDLKTLNRMAGTFIIEEFSRWKPIIENKRMESPSTKHYDEFETMCYNLKKLKKNSKYRKIEVAWVIICIIVFLIASLVYWDPIIFAQSTRDNANTAFNILLSMSLSGLIVFLYRIPKIKDRGDKLIVPILVFLSGCIAVNMGFSLLPDSEIINYIKNVIVGLAGGGVALLFSVYNTMLDESDKKHTKDTVSRETED